MEKLMFYLIIIAVFLQASYVCKGMIYKDDNFAKFRCTNRSPVENSPDTYQSATNVVIDRKKMKKINTEFPLTHIFCGQIKKINGERRATGFHSVAAQSKTSARRKAIKLRNGTYYEIEVYDANINEWIPESDQEKTFFPDDFTVKGISRCISQWAAECYFRKKISVSENLLCLQLYNIPYPKTQKKKFGIRLYYAASNPSNPTLMIRTAYPTNKAPGNCEGCDFSVGTITKCCLMQ